MIKIENVVTKEYIMINEDSICLRCKHLEVITDDKSSDHTYTLVDCAEHLYAFPLKSGVTCPYFEERRIK